MYTALASNTARRNSILINIYLRMNNYEYAMVHANESTISFFWAERIIDLKTRKNRNQFFIHEECKTIADETYPKELV